MLASVVAELLLLRREAPSVVAERIDDALAACALAQAAVELARLATAE